LSTLAELARIRTELGLAPAGGVVWLGVGFLPPKRNANLGRDFQDGHCGGSAHGMASWPESFGNGSGGLATALFG